MHSCEPALSTSVISFKNYPVKSGLDLSGYAHYGAVRMHYHVI